MIGKVARRIAVAAMLAGGLPAAAQATPLSYGQVIVYVQGSFPAVNRLTDTGQLADGAAASDGAHDDGRDGDFTWNANAFALADPGVLRAYAYSDVDWQQSVPRGSGGANSSARATAVFQETYTLISTAGLQIGTPMDLAFSPVLNSSASLGNVSGGIVADANIYAQLTVFDITTGASLASFGCAPNVSGSDPCGDGFALDLILHAHVGDEIQTRMSLSATATTALGANFKPGTDDPLITGVIAEADASHTMTWTLDPLTVGTSYETASGHSYRSAPSVDPVPEPGTLALMGTGLFSAYWGRRRRAV